MIIGLVCIGVLCIVLGLLFSGKPIKIEIKHTHIQEYTNIPELPQIHDDAAFEKEYERSAMKAIDEVVGALNEYMTGGVPDEQK